MCNICKQVASITQRISIQNQLFHRDCIKCSVCSVTVKSAERFIRTEDKISFFCAVHSPEKKIGSSLSIPEDEDDEDENANKEDDEPLEEHKRKTREMVDRQNELIRNIDAKLNLDDKFITKRKPYDFDVIKAVDEDEDDANNEEQEKKNVINFEINDKLDPQAIRQEIFNRALEKVRLKSDEALGITTPENIRHLMTPKQVVFNDETTNNKEVFDKIFENAKDKVKNQIKKEKDKSSGESLGSSPAPIATFDNLDDFSIDDDNNYTSSSDHNTYNKSETSSKFNSTTKTDSTNVTMNSINSNKKLEERDALITPLLTKSKDSVDAKPKNLIFTYKETPLAEIEKKQKKLQVSPVIQKKTSLKTKITQLLTPSEQNAKSSSTSPSRSPRSDATIDAKPKSKLIGGILKRKSPNSRKASEHTEPQIEQEVSSTNSFAFTVTHSPRLGRNTRTFKRQQNEEKRLERLEKERRDKRLRMSQEIQRKLDEVETKLSELEHEGVELEKEICNMDSTNEDERERKELTLYNLIHQKNLFQRVENELNIQ